MKSMDNEGQQPTKIYTYVHRRRVMKVIILSSLGPALWTGACDPTRADAPIKTKTRKNNKMESIKPDPAVQIRIPPVDASTPAETQTATFALG